ncbi:hypothetical protein PSTG_12742 [Puccinia striiformis f. sp. tritici PST-78]|uniref:Nucleolar 27S pre-rRNA processing Urb2/Npa2 C-terminal domain-containing protein n=2 Tax=Puccinia striiformis f. sp. tritici TaxID=168172 RepID=A0A0L0V3S3_9BASI|nr:hypothetical protein PSTG_12742 [Puccinia striiformis f. sp. tritici PST-78]
MSFSKQPAELFRSLRSRDIPVEQRIKLAQLHWNDPKFDLPYKQLYFLRWIFEVEFFEPKNSNKRTNTESFNSPVHYPVFWKCLHQLVSDLQHSDLSTVLGGASPIILIRHTLLEWSNLFEDLEFSGDVYSTLKVIFPIIAQRLTFDLSLDFINQIFHGLKKLSSPISDPVEQTVLLIINGILPTIEHTLNSRKAFNSIILNPEFLNRTLQVTFSPYATSSLKSLVLQIIQTLTLNVENLKKVNLNQESPIEWLEALHLTGKKDPKMAAAVIEIVTHLVSALIRELPNLRSQLFSQHLASIAPQSSNGRSVAVDLAYLHATRTFILHVINNSCEVLKDLGSSTSSNLSASMTSHKVIIRQILNSNLYDPAQPSQHEILDEIAEHCTSHLSSSSRIIAMDSLHILVDLLSLDYTLIEVRLTTILENLIVSPSDSNSSGPMCQFFDGVFNWFSKAKQIPNLFSKWIEIIEAKLPQYSLREISSGPLMDKTFIERAHEEIRLSVSSAQMAVIHDLLSSKFRSIIQSSAICPDEPAAEPSSKRRKISAQKATSPSKEEPTAEAIGTIHQNANLSGVISNFYELLVISASRSSLQSKEWSSLSKRISSFGGEIINTIVMPTLQRWPATNSSKNRFRKFKSLSEQTVLASAFRVLASVLQVQGLHTSSELDALELLEWLELLHQVSSRKTDHHSPELSFELVHILLEFTSQKLSCLKSVDPIIPHTAYETIFKLIEDCTNHSNSWNGFIVSLTSAELPSALWHYLTTTHLSEFATLATPDQINQFAQIAIKLGSQNPDASDQRERLGLLSVNRMVLRSPVFLECASLREPLLKQLVAAFEGIMPLDADSTLSQLDVYQLDSVNSLYDIISDLPLSYLTKWARKRLFNWSFAWNEALLSKKLTSATPPSQALSVIRSRAFLCRILSDPLSSANAEMMKQAIGTTIKSLGPFGTEEEENQDSLIKVTDNLIIGIIAKLMKNMKSGEDSESSFKLLDQFCVALSTRIKPVAKTIIKNKLINSKDMIIISPLKFIAEYGRIHIIDTSREADEEETIFIQRFQSLIRPLVDSLEAALKKTRAKTSSNLSNLAVIELGKIYLQLSRLDGNQTKLNENLIDLKQLLPSIDQIKTTSDHCQLSQNETEILAENLDLFEEMIQINRHRYGTKPKDCVTAFQTLVISHLHLRSSISGGADENLEFQSKLRNSFIKSCKNSNINESSGALRMILNEINGCSQMFIGHKSKQSCDPTSHLFNRFRNLLDVAVLLVLNYPGHDEQGSNSSLEEVILKLLKSLKLIDLDDQQELISPRETLNFYRWKAELIDQICIQDAHMIGRSSLLEILETLIDLGKRKEFQTIQSLHDILVSITSHLNQDCLRRSLINHFPLLVDLLSRLMIPTLNMKNYSRLISDLSSTNKFIAPFSKHAPFLITNLISKISQTTTNTSSSSHLSSNSIEGFVNHGLFSLISTMGKFERNSIGYRILEQSNQFHSSSSFDDHHLLLLDDHNSNCLLNWKKILKNWETLRYKGTD